MSRPEPVTPTPASGRPPQGPCAKLLHEPLRRADGIAGGADVGLPGGLPARDVEGDGLRPGRPDVEPEQHRAPARRGGRRRRQAPDLPERRRERRQVVERGVLRLPEERLERSGRGRPPRGDDRAAQGVEEERLLARVPERHPAAGEPRAEVLAHPARAADAARQRDVSRPVRLHEHLHVLADRVEQAGEDATAVLALVGEVGHVRLEDHRAASGERRRLGSGRDLVRLLRREAEPLDELPEEVAGPLRAARVLPVGVPAVRLERQDAEAVRADVHDGGGRALAVEELVAGDAGLLPGDALERERAAETTGGARRRRRLPAPLAEHPEERGGGILLVLDARPADPAEPAGLARQLHHLHRLRADVESDVPASHRSPRPPRPRGPRCRAPPSPRCSP